MAERKQFWVQGADGKSYGPVEEALLRQWTGEGRIVASSLIRSGPEEAWQTAFQLPELADCFPAVTTPPRFAEPPVSNLPALKAAWRERNYAVNSGGWLQQGWGLFSRELLAVIGCFFLVGMITGSVGQIPFFVGTVINFFFSGILVAGYFYYLLRTLREEPEKTIGDLFAGFQLRLRPLFLSGILVKIFAFLANLPLYIVALYFFFWFTGVSWQEVQEFRTLAYTYSRPTLAPSPSPAQTQAAKRLEAVWNHMKDLAENDTVTLLYWLLSIAALVLPGILVTMFYMFTPLLIMDHNLPVWEAMETSRRMVAKHWFQMTTFGALYLPLLNVLGFCLCCVGLFITVPLTICATVAAYEDIFQKQQKNSSLKNIARGG